MNPLTIILSILAFCSSVLAEDAFAEMNSAIDWVSYTDFKSKDLSKNDKPIVYVLTQPWCGACKNLKKSFVESGDKLVAASKKFNMVAVSGDENNDISEEFKPDGSYIPRIFFAEPNGKLRTDVVNTAGSDKYKYFYTSANLVASAMDKFAEAQSEPASDKEL